ncbi:MAG: FAD-binding protein [Bacteroidetes bacterium]|nr:FAD-binding protein [Bacteroidota bacterium]
MKLVLASLKKQLEGDLFYDDLVRKIYATDASSYRELPLAVAYPKGAADIKKLIAFARGNKSSIIPRTAGTSLAGQVVGSGVVADVSKYMTRIIELNEEDQWVRVEPGVVRDELNLFLKPYGLMFGPETSTSNRAMMGGMIGNNSCGSNSMVYGSTRDHLLEIKAVLSDGSEVEFSSLDAEAFDKKLDDGDFEASLYVHIKNLLAPDEVKRAINREFPDSSIPRRNTGYAIDLLMPMTPFEENGQPFNFCKLIAGSEGTLAFITEAKLKVVPLPESHSGLICAHFDSIYDSLKATNLALRFDPSAVELMDHFILECTKDNIQQSPNRFFVKGDPNAILVIELKRASQAELEKNAESLITELKSAGYGYHFPFITGADMARVWNLRKAGLGLLSTMRGDAKPVPVVEDTAVKVDDLAEYVKEFDEKVASHGLECVHYAHAGSGEIHIRPIINLKTEEGNRLFRSIAEEIALLVKKYKGSLSGEHGDGRLRGEFIPLMIGDANFKLLKQIKSTWDPENIFNPGKIVDTPSMNSSLRYFPGQVTPEFDTALDFTSTDGMLRAAEQCNGSGDCRKTHLIGGTMCPSYMASRNEKDTTRARANVLREVFTRSNNADPFASDEIYEILDLCLSCKGCKAECPSNVDMAKIKAEFLHQRHLTKGIPLRSKLIANINTINKFASGVPSFYNFMLKSIVGNVGKQLLGIAEKRNLPELGRHTFRSWLKGFSDRATEPKGSVVLFVDEFTNYYDVQVGEKAVLLLHKLGYEVLIADHDESGRSYISKGLLSHAKKLAEKNVRLLEKKVTRETPLIGIEPSAILTFRDEYPDLLRGEMKDMAKKLAENTLMIDEFLSGEWDKGNIDASLFTGEEKKIKLHGHCYQKALSSVVHSKKILSIPRNYSVQVIPSGCCGMAGSFGYEKEHYDMSMQIGELVLFPAIRESDDDTLIAAPGTSCRHQIKDGTGRNSWHPVEILYDALIKA